MTTVFLPSGERVLAAWLCQEGGGSVPDSVGVAARDALSVRVILRPLDPPCGCGVEAHDPAGPNDLGAVVLGFGGVLSSDSVSVAKRHGSAPAGVAGEGHVCLKIALIQKNPTHAVR